MLWLFSRSPNPQVWETRCWWLSLRFLFFSPSSTLFFLGWRWVLGEGCYKCSVNIPLHFTTQVVHVLICFFSQIIWCLSFLLETCDNILQIWHKTVMLIWNLHATCRMIVWFLHKASFWLYLKEMNTIFHSQIDFFYLHKSEQNHV